MWGERRGRERRWGEGERGGGERGRGKEVGKGEIEGVGRGTEM